MISLIYSYLHIIVVYFQDKQNIYKTKTQKAYTYATIAI